MSTEVTACISSRLRGPWILIWVSPPVTSVTPVGKGRLRRWLTRCDTWGNDYNLPLGGLYIVHAIKQVSALHRPQRLRPRRERLIGIAAAAPAPRTGTAAREGDTAA